MPKVKYGNQFREIQVAGSTSNIRVGPDRADDDRVWVGPNFPRAGSGKILKFRPVQTSSSEFVTTPALYSAGLGFRTSDTDIS
jgi:hypothetical protein